MLQLNSLTLLTFYLRECSILAEKLLNKAMDSGIKKEEQNLIKEVGYLANVLSVIYFYRKYKKDLKKAFSVMPIPLKSSVENNFYIIWKHVSTMSSEEVSDLAIETIQETSRLSQVIEKSFI